MYTTKSVCGEVREYMNKSGEKVNVPYQGLTTKA